MLLSERVAQKVSRKEKRARINSEVGRVINNEDVVCVKGTSRGRGKQKKQKEGKKGAIKTGSRSPAGKKQAAILFF